MREMKGSGIPWIGKVPSNWLVEPIFSDFVEVTRKNKFGREKKALKFTYGEIVPKANFDADNDNYVADTILKYTIVEPGTIMLNGLNLNYDFISQRIGLVKQKGVITSAYTAFKPINMQKISSKYSTYLFKAYDNCKAFHNMGGGVRKILNFKELSKQPFIHPPIGEQHRIADYLDTKCARIDSIRKNVEAEIEALKEYKKSVITEAVTKGLDPDVEMKDSGIPWIGEIPKEWVICKVKNVVSHIGSGTTPTSGKIEFYENGTVNWIQSGDLYETNKINETNKKVSESAIKLFPALHIYKAKFIVIAMYGASVGNIAISNIDACVNQACCCIKTNEFNNLKYMFYWLFSCKNDFLKITDGGGQPNISQTKIKNQYYLKPPIEEQHRIVDFLDTKCARIDSIIQKKQELLANLDTYKKSLIYEYVTGKKEVPSA